MNRAEEYAFMMRHAENMDPYADVEREQLVALFTAYCLHHDIELDTSECDRAVNEMFDSLGKIAYRYYGGCGLVGRDRFYLDLSKHLC